MRREIACTHRHQTLHGGWTQNLASVHAVLTAWFV
jgi:hypothetical protein